MYRGTFVLIFHIHNGSLYGHVSTLPSVCGTFIVISIEDDEALDLALVKQ